MRFIWNKSFGLWGRLGVHVTPNHLYYLIPGVRNLDSQIWEIPSALVAIDMGGQSQMALLSKFSDIYNRKYELFQANKISTRKPYDYFANNRTFESIGGGIFYCTIWRFKPKRVIEIGSGNSIYQSALAIQESKELALKYTCGFAAIESSPKKVLQNGFPSLPGLVKRSYDRKWIGIGPGIFWRRKIL